MAQTQLERTRTYKYGKIWRVIFERDGYKCSLCKSTSNLTLDHIIAVTRGGRSTSDNLRVLCKSCNTREGIKMRDLDPMQTKQREYAKLWRRTHPGYFANKRKEFVKRNPGYYSGVAREYMALYLAAKI